MRWELPAHSVATSTSWAGSAPSRLPWLPPERHGEGPPIGKLAPKGAYEGSGWVNNYLEISLYCPESAMAMVLHLSSTNQKKGALAWIALIKLAYSRL